MLLLQHYTLLSKMSIRKWGIIKNTIHDDIYEKVWERDVVTMEVEQCYIRNYLAPLSVTFVWPSRIISTNPTRYISHSCSFKFTNYHSTASYSSIIILYSKSSSRITSNFSLLFQMESELERFHSQNMQLELNIDELRQKLKASEKETLRERQKVTFS